jgi:2-phosphosulfolactate phosphatase
VIDVAMTRAELRPAEFSVVIDVLRATSTATQALAAGYRRVLCAESLARASSLRAPGRVLAGERRCLRPAGFDHGNSPLEAAQRRGDELVLATTNGAPTIVAAARCAPTVLLACLLNLDAVIEALRVAGGGGEHDVQLVCSGTDGEAALEDTYVAGRLSAALTGRRTDAALIAEAVARRYPTALDALSASADARVLRAAGLEHDIAYCAQESLLDVVPRVQVTSHGVAVVVREAARATSVAQRELNLAIPSAV